MIKCFAATSAFWIDPQGDIRPCARHKQKAFHVSTIENFSDIFSSNYYQNLNNNLEKDKWPDACNRCRDDEINNLHSKRIFYEDLGLDSEKDVFIDISMGNYCNLKCRMCGPHNSTSWKSDYETLLNNKIIPDLQLDTSPYVISDDQINKLCNFISTTSGKVYIELKGGEPLLMNHTKTMLEKLSNLPNSQSIELLIVTNGTSIPNWFENCISRFTKTNLVVSIDGLDEVFDYIRENSKYNFNMVMNNVAKYQNLKVDLRFNVVVQNLNIHQIFSIHKKLLTFSSNINYITLFEPAIYRANLIPYAEKVKLRNQLNEEYQFLGNYKQTFENIIEFVNTSADIQMLELFKKVTLELDRLRGQSILNVAPHLLN